jgi:hypothetical protein
MVWHKSKESILEQGCRALVLRHRAALKAFIKYED